MNANTFLNHDMLRLQQCIEKHCSKEKAILTQKAAQFKQELDQILKEETNPIIRTQKMQKISLKILKTAERLKLVECQMKNCKEDTRAIIKLTKNMYDNLPASIKAHKIIKAFHKKYAKFLENEHNFTTKMITQYDIDGLKLWNVVAELQQKYKALHQQPQQQPQQSHSKPVKAVKAVKAVKPVKPVKPAHHNARHKKMK